MSTAENASGTGQHGFDLWWCMHDLGAVAGSAPDALVAAASRCGDTDITEYVKEASTCLSGRVLPMSTSPLLSEVQPSAAPQSAAPIHCVLLAVAAAVVPSLAPLCFERCLRPPCCLPTDKAASYTDTAAAMQVLLLLQHHRHTCCCPDRLPGHGWQPGHLRGQRVSGVCPIATPPGLIAE